MAEQTLSMFELDEEKFIFQWPVVRSFLRSFPRIFDQSAPIRLGKPASAKLHIILSYDLSEPWVIFMLSTILSQVSSRNKPPICICEFGACDFAIWHC